MGPERLRVPSRSGIGPQGARHRALAGLVLAAALVGAEPARSKTCTGIPADEAAGTAVLVFEGVVLDAVATGADPGECPRQHLRVGVIEAWKRPAETPAWLGLDERGRQIARLASGPECRGCGAPPGARVVVHVDRAGELLRWVRAGRATGHAWQERARFGDASGREAPGRPDRRPADPAAAWPEVSWEASRGHRVECLAIAREQAFERADLVFAGSAAASRPAPGSRGECRPTVLTFRPQRSWKELPGKELTLHPGASCLGCDLQGASVVVYAERDGQGMQRLIRVHALRKRYDDPVDRSLKPRLLLLAR